MNFGEQQIEHNDAKLDPAISEWRDFIYINEGNTDPVEINSVFEKLEASFKKEDGTKIIDMIKDEYLKMGSGYFRETDNMNVAYKAFYFILEHGNKMDFLEYFEKFKIKAEEEGLYYSYYQYPSLALLHETKSFAPDIEESFAENNVNSGFIAIRNILDTHNFYPDMHKKFDNQILSILKNCEAVTDSYLLKSLTQEVIAYFSQVKKQRSDEFENKHFSNRQFGAHGAMDGMKQLIIEEKKKNGASVTTELRDVDYKNSPWNMINRLAQKDFGLNLKARELIYFFEFIKNVKVADLSKYQDFFAPDLDDQDKSDRLKSLFCLRAGEADQNKLLAIAQEMPTEQQGVFHKIAEFVDLAEKERSGMEELLDGLSTDLRAIAWQDIKNKLFIRASEVIDSFANSLGKDDEINELFKKLENISAEITVLGAILKEAKDNGEAINMAEIKAVDVDFRDFGSTFNDQEKKQILAMAEENWRQCSNDKMTATIVSGLKNVLENETSKQRSYLLKYKDLVAGFIRFEKLANGHLYAGSLNVRNDLKSGNIGNYLLEKALLAESKSNILEAAAPLFAQTVCAYIEKVGFVIDGIIEDYHHSGETLLSIKTGQSDQSLASGSKTLRLESIDYKDLDQSIGSPTIVLRFNMQTEKTEYQLALKKLLVKTDDNLQPLDDKKDKYIVTRYFQDKNEPGDTRYLVFERRD